MTADAPVWPDQLYDCLRALDVTIFGHVPDAGHKVLINRAGADPAATSIGLTIESEGIGLITGAHLGGQRAVLAMQSSGVGNCINMMSLIANCSFPFVTLVTMRGEFGEFNSWQVPMGKATKDCLEAIGLTTYCVEDPDSLLKTVDAALFSAFASQQRSAVLMSQKLLGRKEW